MGPGSAPSAQDVRRSGSGARRRFHLEPPFQRHGPGSVARQLRLVAMTIDYRLAPQWLYPSPEEDISAAVDWLGTQILSPRLACSASPP